MLVVVLVNKICESTTSNYGLIKFLNHGSWKQKAQINFQTSGKLISLRLETCTIIYTRVSSKVRPKFYRREIAHDYPVFHLRIAYAMMKMVASQRLIYQRQSNTITV